MTQKIFEKISIISSYIFIAIFCLCKGFALDQSDKIYIIISAISLIFICTKILFSEFTKKEVIIYSCLIVLSGVIFLFSKRLTIILSVLLILSSKDMKPESIFKTIFYTRLFSFLCMIFLSSLEIIPSNNILFYRDGEELSRKAFGYSHPNEAASQLFLIVTSGILFLKNKKMKNIACLISIVPCFLLYKVTYSRSSILVTSMFIIVELITINIKFFNKILKKFSVFIGVLPIVITAFFAIFYGKVEFLDKINELLTGRVYYVDLICKSLNPRLFGISNDVISNELNFDNSYIKILYYDGIVLFLVYIIGFIYFIKNAIAKNKFEFISFALIFAFYGISEGYLNNAIINFSLLLYPFVMKKDKMISDENLVSFVEEKKYRIIKVKHS